MRVVRVGIAGAFALALPLTASSASAQARVEVDGWWEAQPALEMGAAGFGDFEAEFDDVEVIDDFGNDGVGYPELDRGIAEDGRVGYVDPRGRVAVDVDNRRSGWSARVVVLGDGHRARREVYSYRPMWRTVRWNARFDMGRRGRFVDHRLDRGDLRDVLGRRTVDRLENHADRIGAEGRLIGRWIQYGPRGRILQVRAGATPVAELIAYGPDRRVDVVRLNVRRWYVASDRYDRYENDRSGDRYDADRYDDRYKEKGRDRGRRDGRGRGR